MLRLQSLGRQGTTGQGHTACQCIRGQNRAACQNHITGQHCGACQGRDAYRHVLTGEHRERGMVTVELAIGLLTVAMVTVVALFTVSLVVTQTRCGDAASAIARQLARGDAAGAATARANAPKGAQVVVRTSGTAVRVEVKVDSSLGALGPFHLSGAAQAVLEPGVKP